MPRKGLMAPPDQGEAPHQRGLMAPDHASSGSPLSVKAVLWAAAGVLGVVELMVKTLLS
jgi:hypothetical protein